MTAAPNTDHGIAAGGQKSHRKLRSLGHSRSGSASHAISSGGCEAPAERRGVAPWVVYKSAVRYNVVLMTSGWTTAVPLALSDVGMAGGAAIAAV